MDENTDARQAIFEPPTRVATQNLDEEHEFMMTCLCWILGYMRLEIWHRIGLSGD